MRRSRGYYRHQRVRIIAKKMKRVRLGMWWILPGKEGSLSKGKTHCSCGLCTRKTKTCGWRKVDRSRQDQMAKEIKEHMETN